MKPKQPKNGNAANIRRGCKLRQSNGCMAVAALMAGLFWAGCRKDAGLSPELVTSQRLKNCYAWALAVEGGTARSVVSQFDTNMPDALAFLEVLARFTNQFGGRFATNIVMDGWGRPLRFTNEPPPDQALRIWSVGRNGIDELGRGDDMVYGPEDAVRENLIGR